MLKAFAAFWRPWFPFRDVPIFRHIPLAFYVVSRASPPTEADGPSL